MAKHKNVFMGVETEYDPVKHREELEKKFAAAWITPKAYWATLKASWYEMDSTDKKEELDLIDLDLPSFLGGAE